MRLTLLDWSAVAGYLLITLILGLYFRRKSGQSTEDYFVSGRDVSWWLAGTSMVATTFAADTPLLVTGLVYTQGIAGNWLWWSFLPSGMMTVFLFARLWRRSELLTDVQFAELRYSGKPAAFLRGFRAVYLGLLMNCLILGWVAKAMITIIHDLLGVSNLQATLICVLVLVPFTGIYVTLGGLWGVLWTDLFQFVLKMGIVIVVAYYAVSAAGGMSALLAKLGMMRQVMIAQSGDASVGDPTALLPHSSSITAAPLWTVPVLTFLVFLCLQWWAFWYPGAEPGGGGYIAQRIFSARDERHGLLSVLWFNVAHYGLRPWPWILTGLAAIVLYPNLEQPESGYMRIVADHVPHAFMGIVIAGFLAAFMSTVATQLNWGASYLVADFYRRFLRRDASESHYVNASRVATVLLVIASGLVAWGLTSIRAGWQWVLELGAGTGAVYLLRWYWWRINAWSEIAAMATALVVSLTLRMAEPFHGSATVVSAENAIVTTAVTSIVWVIVTFSTRPEPDDVLMRFYRKVRPHAAGWMPVAAKAPDVPRTRDLGTNLLSWMLGCGMVYAALFGVGKILLHDPGLGAGLLVVSAVCAGALYWNLERQGWGADKSEGKAARV
jgi:solute:Na+ symporter, SSS family